MSILALQGGPVTARWSGSSGLDNAIVFPRISDAIYFINLEHWKKPLLLEVNSSALYSYVEEDSRHSDFTPLRRRLPRHRQDVNEDESRRDATAHR
jgi:hypothetical protein